MNSIEWLVLLGGVGLTIFIVYYFFGSKGEGEMANVSGKIQEIEVVVDGGYEPDIINLKIGKLARIVFNRKDTGSCTEWVIFDSKMPTKEKKSVKVKLAEGKKTMVSFTPTTVGEYGFDCGMGMVKGRLIVS